MGVHSNFSFLVPQDERLARLGALAERYFFDDAPSTLIKLRQLAEFLAKEVAARLDTRWCRAHADQYARHGSLVN